MRFHAAERHIDPHKVGVLGFSAGGHLVAAVSTHFDKRLYGAVDAADKESCRPLKRSGPQTVFAFTSEQVLTRLPPRCFDSYIAAVALRRIASGVLPSSGEVAKPTLTVKRRSG